MEVIYSPKAAEDLKYWKKTGNRAVQKKITTLIEAIQVNPYEGIGKPEPLRYNLAGAWSRRINYEHRLVYEINDRNELLILDILSLKGHY
jgi:toxin YoeB